MYITLLKRVSKYNTLKKIKMGVVYEDSSSRICGVAMRSKRKSRDRKWRQSRALSGRMFCACATGSCAISTLVGPFDRKWRSHVTGSDVSHVTGSNPVRKYVLRMHNWKLRNIRPSRAFWPEVTSVTWLEEALIGSRFCACPVFPALFSL
jgi:hypothetical protein